MVLEFYRKTLINKYNGDIEAMKKDGCFIAYNTEKIKSSFNFGNGTENDFKNYMKANKKLCLYIEV